MGEIQSTQYCVECERLQAELDGAVMLKSMAENALRKAEAELDECERQRDIEQDIADKAEAERDRYRKALERIAGYRFAGDSGLIFTAQMALKGDNDE